MTGKDILIRYKELQNKLTFCLSTMEKKDDIKKIREELKELQQKCPHHDPELNFSLDTGKCPNCGGRVLND